MASQFPFGFPEALVWGFLKGMLAGVVLILLLWGATELAGLTIRKLRTRDDNPPGEANLRGNSRHRCARS